MNNSGENRAAEMQDMAMDIGKVKAARVAMINGPVVRAEGVRGFKVREMVMVGDKKLLGEVISIDSDKAIIQVYEETEGLKAGEEVVPTGKALSLKLGPGIIGNIFDGIQRPLQKIEKISGNFISEGIGLISIDPDALWQVELKVSEGDELVPGSIYATVQESSLIEHRLMVPPEMSGKVVKVAENGKYRLEDEIVSLEDNNGVTRSLRLYQEWPVREPRPMQRRMSIEQPLITGQRVLDVFFPLGKGGTAALPGGFGTGKTMTQHQLAKWSDADIIVYIGCGERGNEMTEVLEDFPKLMDPKSGRPLMERTVLIANTSNMPVAAREASIYTGITMAEYYRDMGYHVAIMADSTSRWAEALREISGRLEEMPAEEGYPAYLPSRLAQFYERAGYVKTLSGSEGSVTVIGAVSPPGGDFSEPVTENTKRFVNAFLALDRNLAYARHYPAINYLSSYSGYIKMLSNWFKDNVAEDIVSLRAKMLELLHEEKKLMEIVELVGEDVLPDSQRLVIEISRIIKNGFLQQNAMHKEDTYVPLQKQYLMLRTINLLYEKASKAVKDGIPISQAKDDMLFAQIVKMKYNIPNDNLEGFEQLRQDIESYYEELYRRYEE
ncbi:V-type ATP synthase alpha chain 2 [Peptoclostridium acidaminophilum DSM 3953]|uniref:V-type ATP synthase alpha chain n=2 Tax=Peptoclostridium acidaminophilum TaxID=1731 RepID=W8TCX7_PEPAC|nr:V-type ATP synthase subunit A [Peptoclostridium acidaminophilum]AHM55658.1 V-type ATP synthase alpha chain 2 [Peptoclostridium acidaminophilum DSM 3953]